MPDFEDLEIAVGLGIGFLEDDRTDVIQHRLAVDPSKEIVNQHLDAFSTLEQIDFEGLGLAIVLLMIRDPCLQDLGEMGDAGERRHEVTVAQIALLDVIGVEREGDLWFVHDFRCRYPIAEDVVLPG